MLLGNLSRSELLLLWNLTKVLFLSGNLGRPELLWHFCRPELLLLGNLRRPELLLWLLEGGTRELLLREARCLGGENVV